jgi:hypothetical protein
MPISDFLQIGGNEVINLVRLQAYLANVGSPFDTGADICSCDTLTRRHLDPDGSAAPATYDTPATDPAPWYDADVPESGQFLGILPLSIEGIDGSTRARDVTNAVGGGGVFGPARDLPRTITVSALLVGTTCCGVAYGLHWLSEALQGCSDSPCSGDCVTAYNCCPETSITPEQFKERHQRTFHRVALVSGPEVTDRQGTGSCGGSCGAGGDILQVEFVLVAARPWPYTAPTELLEVNLPIGGTGDCIEWCLNCTPSECLYSSCDTSSVLCADPLNTVTPPPQPSLPTTGFCVPLAPERACYSIDLSTRPGWASDVPILTIRSGSAELRNVRVVLYEKPGNTTQTCDQIADSQRCNPINQFYVTYIPANSAITFDGRTGFATTECAPGCESATTAYGDLDGGPVVFNDLNCAMFCLCVETDPLLPPAANASISFSVSGKGY